MVKELGNLGITLGLLGISPIKVFSHIRELPKGNILQS